jgi:hypothetical protein
MAQAGDAAAVEQPQGRAQSVCSITSCHLFVIMVFEGSCWGVDAMFAFVVVRDALLVCIDFVLRNALPI